MATVNSPSLVSKLPEDIYSLSTFVISMRYLHALSPCVIYIRYLHALSPCVISMRYLHESCRGLCNKAKSFPRIYSLLQCLIRYLHEAGRGSL